jgi:thiamine-monophosphate kinase
MNITEETLIQRIRRRVPSSEGGVLRLGIGDDAALVRTPPGADWVVTSDPFIEDVHFLADTHAPDVVGYKALARATSDLAAMGAQPQLFLLNLTIPASRTGRWLEGMLTGMGRAARKFRLRLAGGDTSQGPKSSPTISLHVTVLGSVERGRELRRTGAQPGDAVFVSGPLGAAQLGLELILHGRHRETRWKKLLAPQFHPVPAILLGQWLAHQRIASAAMDLSDGLSSDLPRLCKASAVGARIYAEKLPCVVVPRELRPLKLDALTLALHGGEDYGLLFTVPARSAPRIPNTFHGTTLTHIGEIVRGRGVSLVDARGKISPLKPRGWDHFRTR